MESALCTLDNITYTATNFNQVDGFEDKRKNLVCTECNGPAFFRGPTRNGREACFGARPHAEGCALATLEHDGPPAGHGDEGDEIFTTGQRIVVDFNYGALETVEATQPVGGQANACNIGVGYGQAVAIRQNMTRRMSSLLRSLIETAEFRRSTQIIEIAGEGEFTVGDFFVNFSEVTGNHINCFRGYWGMIPDTQLDHNGTLWFNSGGREDISVLLDRNHIGAVYRRFHIDHEEEIAGAYLLVMGVLKLSASGKKYVEIVDPAHFTLRLA
ncbi:hypothetical protein [Geobacter sp. AOG1]|uniref:hypothetical protein n=1 Tax=Geobacter sp. AOG1 TaxID=1566346 RepID=UPI001CC33A58|nr:hypothetical protein [Geobacter sp. AOG1]GFE56814.1 hypothetical protein AOG1_06930 [Geobacter sp. AOG1]